MNTGLLKLAEELLFSPWLGDEERDVLRAAWDEFKEFYKKNVDKARIQKKVGQLRLYRLLSDTGHFLKFVGDPQYLSYYEGYVDLWRQMGFNAIADGFKIRADEAKYSDEDEPELPDIDIEWEADTERGIPEGLEGAPETVRSLVAMILRHTDVFYKMARG